MQIDKQSVSKIADDNKMPVAHPSVAMPPHALVIPHPAHEIPVKYLNGQVTPTIFPIIIYRTKTKPIVIHSEILFFIRSFIS